MEERQNTLVCTFDHHSSRISAYEIYEWIDEQLKVIEVTVAMIQIGGPKRQLFIKFVELPFAQEVLQRNKGLTEYKLSGGVISKVRTEVAGMGNKRVRIANLPRKFGRGK
jgi:hypothetical protein